MVDLAHIFIYPIKSLDGASVTQAQILASGALKGDREFAIVDYQGKVVNGKRTAAVHQIRAQFDLPARTVSLQIEGKDTASQFHLEGDRIPLEGWFSNYFGFPVKLIQNREMGFPDDTESPAATVISTETLYAIAQGFPDLNLEAMRLRLRTNLEIMGGGSFWEDRLYGDPGNLVPFQIGPVQFWGVNPCQRCIVPTRDPKTGDPYPNFQKTFVAERKATLPEWVAVARFNHYYRLAVNTRISTTESGKVIQIGDTVIEGYRNTPSQD